jgi:methyl-accepting chemotaxis protein
MGLTTRKNYRLFLYVNTLVIVLLGAVVAGYGLFWLLPAGLGESYSTIMASVQEIRKVLFWRVVALYVVISLFIVLGIVVLHLFYSHRIAGPAYRIGREAAKIAQGDLTGNIRFRRKDNLTDMADLLNDVAAQYRDRISIARDYLAAIEAESKNMHHLIRQGKERVALKQTMEKMASNVKNIECCLLEMRGDKNGN